MDFLNEILEQVNIADDVQLNRILEVLKDKPFSCKQPMLAVEMIKRKIRTRADGNITIDDITRWGNRTAR